MSAGMSGDLEAAVAEGATHLRVGSAILGSRAATPVTSSRRTAPHCRRGRRLEEHSMAGALRKTMVYLGLAEDQGRYDDEYYEGYDEHVERSRSSPSTVGAEVTHLQTRQPVAHVVRSPEVGRHCPHHDDPPAHLQRGQDDRRELPRRHPGHHEPHRHERRRRQAARRLRRRPGLRPARLDRAGHQQGVPALAGDTSRSPPRTARSSPAAASSTRAERPELGSRGRVGQTSCHDSRPRGPVVFVVFLYFLVLIGRVVFDWIRHLRARVAAPRRGPASWPSPSTRSPSRPLRALRKVIPAAAAGRDQPRPLVHGAVLHRLGAAPAAV